MRRTKFGIVAATATAAMLAMTPAAVAVPTSTAASTCATVYWGSLAKTKTLSTTSALTNVRTGQHTCYDRMVIDLKSKPAGYTVKYVDKFVGIASGIEVKTTGGAKLQIQLHAPASTSYNLGAQVKTLNYKTFKQQVWLGSFEGETLLGVSTRARLPMRAFLLNGPGTSSRLVIDVAHQW
ncbi:AMIN-like domain-containing (lipo)protein [Glutamicibacter soli]|nr:hypothetical protein [Glutamicibacter soli]